MTQGELEQLAIPFQRKMSTLESRTMADLIRRIQINGEITSGADWQINRLYEMGKSKSEIKQAIAAALGQSEVEIDSLYRDALSKEYARNRAMYQVKEMDFIPFEKNRDLQDIIRAVEEQTAKELKNITKSLGFAVRGPDGKVVQTPLLDFYQDTLDNAMMDIASGAFDYNTVLKRTIQTMTNSGLRSIDYDSGWSNRVDVAARRAVMTGFNQLQGRINEQVAKDLKTDYFEVSWHGGARPEHQVWQGGVFSKRELETVCGLGSITGLLGTNCYHQYNAFIPGVSTRTYTDEQIDDMNVRENTAKEYNGKKYTTYEGLQQQRKLETLMRKQRQDIKLLELGKASKDDILAAKVRYQTTMFQYVNFSDKMKLPQQKERIYMDGLGRMASGNVKPKAARVAKNSKSDIIKSRWNGLDYEHNYTKKSAMSRLKAEYGIQFVDSRKYPMNETLLSDCVGWLDSFSKEFPGFKARNPVSLPEIHCALPSKAGNAVGYYQYYTNAPRAITIGLNGAYHSDQAAFQKYVSACIESGWYPANATLHKTFVHEYGHHVSNSMRYVSGNKDWQHGFMEECIEEYNKTSKVSIKTYQDCASLVSRYGSTSESELFAETFAEYFGGDNPRDFAMIFGNKLERILKGVK